MSPKPCNTPTAGGSRAPERLLPRKLHKATALSPVAPEPRTRKHEDRVGFLPDSLGSLTNRCLNSFLSKVRTVAFATKQLGCEDYHHLEMGFNVNDHIDTHASFFYNIHTRRHLSRALSISWLPQNSSKPVGGGRRIWNRRCHGKNSCLRAL